jgi:hypothetical protein
MESISPELALVDPELAERARALLPEVGSCLDLVGEQPELTTPSRRARTRVRISREAFGQIAAWLVIPSIALNIALLRTDSAAEPVPATTAGAISFPASAAVRRAAPRPSAPKPKRAGVESARHVRTARPRVATQLLRWPANRESVGYDVVVWRGHRRIADVWTTKPKVAIETVACRGGKALRAGRYLWFVYPLVDSHPRRYGPLAKWGEFAVRAGLRCGVHP